MGTFVVAAFVLREHEHAQHERADDEQEWCWARSSSPRA